MPRAISLAAHRRRWRGIAFAGILRDRLFLVVGCLLKLEILVEVDGGMRV